MKIIISRKGIDSSFGNIASPVLQDGRMCWLPIPENNRHKDGLPTYNDIIFLDTNLGKVIEDLSAGKFSGNDTSHLDPDLWNLHRKRSDGWRPIFGQTGAAEKHLRNRSVGVGDIFLFFGWFKKAIIRNGCFQYEKGAPNLHVLYGWLQISEILDVEDMREMPQWAKMHPHLIGRRYGDLDVIYVSSEELTISGNKTGLPGGGVFPYLKDELILTANGRTRSVWKLPKWFYPEEGKPALSYHEKISRWEKSADGVCLNVASRGQEFVLDADHYPEAKNWAHDKIKLGSGCFLLDKE